MDVRVPRYAPVVLFVFAAASAGCDSNPASPTSPAALVQALPSPQTMPRPGATSLPTSPIPIPGTSRLTGVAVAAGTSHSLPFFLRFGCGVVSEGTLLVATDIADGDAHSTSQLRVRVGR